MSKIFGISRLPITTLDSVLNGSINQLPLQYPRNLIKHKNFDKYTPNIQSTSKIYTKIRNGFCNLIKGIKK